MTTAPFDPAVLDLIRGTHAQRLRATAAGVDLDVEDYMATWDEDSSPRVMLRLTCGIPGDADVLEALDPRAGVRVVVFVGYRLPDGSWDEQQVADLGLRSRRVSRPAGTMTLVCASDEAMLIDAAESAAGVTDDLEATSYPNALSAIVDIVNYGLALGGPLFPVDVVAHRWFTNDKTTYLSPPASSGGDSWANVETAASALDADFFDDGDRVFRLEPRSYTLGASSLSLAVGAGGTLIDTDAGVDRETWANAVTIRWRRDTPTGPAYVFGSAQVTAGPYAGATAGRRSYAEFRDGQVTQLSADAICAAVLRRMLARARSYTLDTVSAWWVRPGDTVTVQLVTGEQERHLVSRLTHSTGGRMQIVTRLPDNESTIGE